VVHCKFGDLTAWRAVIGTLWMQRDEMELKGEGWDIRTRTGLYITSQQCDQNIFISNSASLFGRFGPTLWNLTPDCGRNAGHIPVVLPFLCDKIFHGCIQEGWYVGQRCCILSSGALERLWQIMIVTCIVVTFRDSHCLSSHGYTNSALSFTITDIQWMFFIRPIPVMGKVTSFCSHDDHGCRPLPFILHLRLFRCHPSPRPSYLAPRGMELGNMLFYVLGSAWILKPVYQLDCLGWKCSESLTYLVRYLWVATACLHKRLSSPTY